MLTDIKNVFWQNPLRPAFRKRDEIGRSPLAPMEWSGFEEGLYWVGHDGAGSSAMTTRDRGTGFLSHPSASPRG